MPDSQHLGSPVNDSRRWLSAATTSGSRPSDAAVLTRVIAYLQFAGACLAVMWLVVRECPRNCVGMIERKRHAFNIQEKSRSSEGF